MEKVKKTEHDEFVLNPSGFIKGFLSRRKAANEALRGAGGKTSAEQVELANIAAWYNRMFNAAILAFKDPDEFGDYLKELEGGK